MSKEKSSAVNNFIKAFVNPRAWVGYDMMKEVFYYLLDAFSKFFVRKQGKQYNKIDDVMIKLSLSEKDILERKKGFFLMAIIMLVVSLLVFGYTLYHLLYRQYLAVGIGSVVLLLSLTFAFRYHFWYFQLKERKLGCSLGEWFRKGLLGAKE
jgi:intracellular multiplication protein IcmV